MALGGKCCTKFGKKIDFVTIQGYLRWARG
jgi:hypothetical protein